MKNLAIHLKQSTSALNQWPLLKIFHSFQLIWLGMIKKKKKKNWRTLYQNHSRRNNDLFFKWHTIKLDFPQIRVIIYIACIFKDLQELECVDMILMLTEKQYNLLLCSLQVSIKNWLSFGIPVSFTVKFDIKKFW